MKSKCIVIGSGLAGTLVSNALAEAFDVLFFAEALAVVFRFAEALAVTLFVVTLFLVADVFAIFFSPDLNKYPLNSCYYSLLWLRGKPLLQPHLSSTAKGGRITSFLLFLAGKRIYSLVLRYMDKILN